MSNKASDFLWYPINLILGFEPHSTPIRKPNCKLKDNVSSYEYKQKLEEYFIGKYIFIYFKGKQYRLMVQGYVSRQMKMDLNPDVPFNYELYNYD